MCETSVKPKLSFTKTISSQSCPTALLLHVPVEFSIKMTEILLKHQIFNSNYNTMIS